MFWQNNNQWPIFTPDDEKDLYRRSVVKEFHEKKPRRIADGESYAEWRKEAHAKAAAHHLRGMKAAQGAGDMKEARKHGDMYNSHLRILGEDPYGPVPESVKKHAGINEDSSFYHFKPHNSDSLIVKNEENMEKSETSVRLTLSF